MRKFSVENALKITIDQTLVQGLQCAADLIQGRKIANIVICSIIPISRQRFYDLCGFFWVEGSQITQIKSLSTGVAHIELLYHRLPYGEQFHHDVQRFHER